MATSDAGKILNLAVEIAIHFMDNDTLTKEQYQTMFEKHIGL